MKLKIKRSVSFEASVQEMSADDVRARIGTREYEAIKAKDPHPLFVDLKVAKQGPSYGPVIIGNIKKTMKKLWGAPRIKELANLMSKGVALMFKHGETNDQTGRDKVGRTLKGWTENEDGSLVARSVGYISSAFAGVQEMVNNNVIDACSIEAMMKFGIGGPAQLVVDKVLGLSAVALCRSDVDGVPGFQGASIVGAVQEMAKLSDVLEEAGIDLKDVSVVGDDGEPTAKVKNSKRRGRRRTVGDEGITLSEVKVFIDEGGISPDKLYPTEKLLDVPAVKDAVQSEVKEQMATKATEHETKVTELQTELDKRDTTIKEKDTSIDNLNNELKPHKGIVRRTKVSDIVKKSALMENAPKKKADYIAEQVARALPEDLDLSTDEGGTAIEKGIKDQLEDITRLNITFGEGDGGDGGGGGDGEEDLEDSITGDVSQTTTTKSTGNPEVDNVKKAMSAGINPLEPGAVAAHAKGGK